VLHWFTGSKSELRRAIKLGCYFSVNAAMMKNDRGRDLIVAIPDDRLLAETDAPFTRVVDRPSTPSDVAITVDILAGLRQVDVNVVAEKIRSNLKTMLNDQTGGKSAQEHLGMCMQVHD
jgi:TatD DNase family protein